MDIVLNWLEQNLRTCERCSVLEVYQRFHRSVPSLSLSYGDFCSVYFLFVILQVRPLGAASAATGPR